ncbi:MAG: mannose-1-phosphate guanylyltransferase/mannose-6-phosphate isomerase, partial [Gammaproteobacteria bacterium]|nr:mannose-1-phosphate guanylyltransferase/mannose-6-phosphate isomerase [Gammaproteobacteria bacterium]
MMLIPVILCGGSGSRLWPLSREHFPKQLLALTSQYSLLQQTLIRSQTVAKETPPIIIANQNYRFLVAEQLHQIKIPSSQIILEPCGRNTAPAIGLAALQALSSSPDSDPILMVLPADHLLPNTKMLTKAMQLAMPLAAAGQLVCFGITPTKAATGYGYIDAGKVISPGIHTIKKFIEKPKQKAAEKFSQSGHHYWNSGMFVFSARTFLSELKKYANEIYASISMAFAARNKDLEFTVIPEELFLSCPSDSIDYAIMEHTEKAVVIPLETEWHDIGSWQALWQTGNTDKAGNVIEGDVIAKDSTNCYIHSEKRLVATLGLKNQVVVETDDAILVADKNHCQDVKTIVEELKQKNRSEATALKRVYRPWGHYESLSSGNGFQVKRITVQPGAKLSLQSHKHRAEHWVVVAGTATIIRGEKTLNLTANQSTYIPVGEK